MSHYLRANQISLLLFFYFIIITRVLPQDLTVTGAGDASFNGDYNFFQTLNGKNAYKISTGAPKHIYWNGSQWQFGVSEDGTNFYFHTGSTTTPPSGGWQVGPLGTSPAPSVSGTDADPLPVELISFYAETEGNNIKLVWETATELNNYGFEIEQKFETGNWKKIGFIFGHGNSNSPKHYSFINKNPGYGKSFYRLKQIDFDGAFDYSDSVEVSSIKLIQDTFILKQNYPNPFNPETVISYQLLEFSNVELRVYDILGNKVATLINEEKHPGSYDIIFNASNYPSGVYYYQITIGKFSETRKMILLK